MIETKCGVCNAPDNGNYFKKGRIENHRVCKLCFYGSTTKLFENLKVKYDRSPTSFLIIRDKNLKRIEEGKQLNVL